MKKMSSECSSLHFLVFPFMAQGHMIPMIDIARLLASHGNIVTIVTTPLNAKRFEPSLSRAIQSGLKIQLLELQFPNQDSNLPHYCENLDMLPSLGLGNDFFVATNQFQESVEGLIQEFNPKPNCIISDVCLPYTSKIASNLGIPRITFTVFCCFCVMCKHCIFNSSHRVLENVKSDYDYFVVPELSDPIELTVNQLPRELYKDKGRFGEQIEAAEIISDGFIINSFEELEPAYVQQLKKIKGNNVWCVGPVSLCNKDELDKVERGNKASIDEYECLKWLDLQKQDSVLYVCFGSLCNLVTSQLIELALGLEASNRPFIWAIRGGEISKKLESWIEEDGFENRTKERGLIIRGWAPQVLILSHPSTGGFLTHCGWNSALEAITAGKPMVTWPLFADQFCNERLVVDVLNLGVKVGVEVANTWGKEDEIGVLIKGEEVKRAIERLMDGGEKSQEIRKKVQEFSVIAKKAMEKNGSSYNNIKLLIEYVRLKANVK